MKTNAFAIAIATCALAYPACARAQNSNITNVSPGAASVAARMVPAQAVLDKTLNARKIEPGQQIQMKLTDTVHLKNGVELPKGTTLVATISTDHMQDHGPSRLAVRFAQADLKNGETIPIRATIEGIASPEYTYLSDNDYGDMPTPPAWNGKTLNLDIMGAASGFNMHSRIAGQNSGVFESNRKDNLKIPAQTQFELAIAPTHGNGTSSGV